METQTKVVPIVVIQSSQTGNQYAQEQLPVAGFAKGIDYVLVYDEYTATQHVAKDDQPQLLITGSFRSNEEAAQKFVRKMMGRNPLLIAMSFSSFGVKLEGSPYKEILRKGVGTTFCKEMVGAMREFLSQHWPTETKA